MAHTCCDTKSGIARSIRTLGGLHRLIQDRYNWAHDITRTTRDLHTWVILGRWKLDNVGNLKPLRLLLGEGRRGSNNINTPIDIFPNLPPVLLFDEFVEQTKKIVPGAREVADYFEVAILPSPKYACPTCHQTWTIKNVHTALCYKEHGNVIVFYHLACVPADHLATVLASK